MGWSRREFLASLLAGVGSYGYARTLPLGERPDSFLFYESDKKGFSILQGMTDESTAQFSLVLPKRNQWSISVEAISPNISDPLLETTVRVFNRIDSDFAVYRLDVSGLTLSNKYRLNVLDSRGQVQDTRHFQALDLKKSSPKIAFISCALDHFHRDDIWGRLEQQAPDVIFFLGDNVYADRTSLLGRRLADDKQLWQRYVETRNRVSFYYQSRLTPVIATWDDHDFGGNNVTSEYAWADASREIFSTFFAQEVRPSLSSGPGIARKFSAFGGDFVLFDDRSFRDNLAIENRVMLGEDQEKWFLDHLRLDRPTWLLNGSMFFGAYTGKDSFEGQYAEDFKRFVDKLKVSDGLFAFASGDVHFSEVQDLEAAIFGYSTFEMVSSSIHSTAIAGHQLRFHNDRRREAVGNHNFMIFEGSFGGERLEGELASIGAGGELFRTLVKVQR